MFPHSQHSFLDFAVFRFEDVCVKVQEGMDGYLRTAALEKKAGIEATFRWLRRRKISICLLTDYSREAFFLLLERLDWGVGEEEFIQMAVVEESNKVNPIQLAFESAGLRAAQQAIVVVDTPRLLQCATAVGTHFVFGVTNGRSSYRDLAPEPFRTLLDSVLQLPNYLLRNLPGENLNPALRGGERSEPPRLWYPSIG